MASLKALCLAAVAAFSATAAAHAADLPAPLPPEAPYPVAEPVAFGSGWYLRGDGGASFNQVSDLRSTFSPPNSYPPYGSYPGGFAYNGASVATSGFLGGGVGYQINNYFRVDVTGEYRFGAKYDNIESYTAYCFNGSGRCQDNYSSRLSSVLLLANAYIDLGTWYGITPFIGAGVGGAFNHFGVLEDHGVDTGGYGSTYATHENNNFAWAVMAGFDYSLTSRLKLEAGYRYVDMGHFQSAGIVCNPSGGPCITESQRLKLTANEIRVGLRYSLADFAPMPRPVIAKY